MPNITKLQSPPNHVQDFFVLDTVKSTSLYVDGKKVLTQEYLCSLEFRQNKILREYFGEREGNLYYYRAKSFDRFFN